MWIEDLHPRDEYGRFRLTGASGRWDRMAGGLEGHAGAMAISEWETNQARQSHFLALRDAGQLTPEQDAEWDRLGERAAQIRDAIPKAYWKGMRPHDDGTWRYPPERRPRGVRSDAAFDERGRKIPSPALLGHVRVGDMPDRGRSEIGPLAGGAWHAPGEYWPGRVPLLRDDYGYRLSALEPKPSVSRQHRYDQGSFTRAETRAEKFGGHRAAPYSTRDDQFTTLASAEVQGAFMISPLNPVSRRRSARKKRDRKQTITWIQRLSDRMEGR